MSNHDSKSRSAREVAIKSQQLSVEKNVEIAAALAMIRIAATLNR